MSHQTGIKASDNLHKVFNESRKSESNVRLMKIIIENEQLECSTKKVIQSNNWEDDYDALVLPLLDDKSACYIIYRLHDDKNWIFISFTPDSAPVRQKMLYAATKSTLKQQFGDALLTVELNGTVVDDVSLKGYHAHVNHTNAPPPLTYGEEELQLMKENESNANISVTTRHQTVKGLQFPMEDALLNAINDYCNLSINYVQMVIDISNERIKLSNSGNISADELSDKISTVDPQYHVFRFNHVFENESLSSNFFIYSMPGYSVSVKSRMLFSSCKSTLVDGLEQNYNIKFDKKLELDGADKLSEKSMFDELHPPKVEAKQKFGRPKPPGKRGPSRRPPNNS